MPLPLVDSIIKTQDDGDVDGDDDKDDDDYDDDDADDNQFSLQGTFRNF